MRKEIQELVEKTITAKVFPGCVIGVVHSGGRREVLPFGRLTYAADSPEVSEDTTYDLASVTKSIPVASLTLTLMSERRFKSTDKVTEYIPELKNDHNATIEDMLTYRVSGPRLSTLQKKTPDEILKFIYEHGFEAPPGESHYSNLPALLLGIILERVTGEKLDHLARTYFFDPLEMSETTFFPDVQTPKSNIAPTEIVDGAEVRGIVHDESARVFAKAGRAVGHAGLFSTAPDILNFLEALLQGRLPAVLAGAQKGLGWQQAEPWFTGTRFGDGAFGKTGFTGTSVAVDPSREIAFVILSNRTYPQRPSDVGSLNSAMNRFRTDISDLLLG